MKKALLFLLITTCALAQQNTFPPSGTGGSISVPLTVPLGGTNCITASITCVNNISGGSLSGAVVGTTDTQTMTNKTVDGVTPTVLGYVDATSSIQTQLNAKAGGASNLTTANALAKVASAGVLTQSATINETGGVFYPTMDSTCAIGFDKADDATNILGLDTTNTRLIHTLNAIANVPADGILLQNTTLSTSGVKAQMPPREEFCGHAWNTTSVATDNTICAAIQLLPEYGLAPNGLMEFGFNLNGAGYTYPITMKSTGDVGIGSGSLFYWSGRSTLTSPANGQFQIENNALNGPGIAATNTGDVSACYNGTSFQLTFGSVCGTSLAVYKDNITPVAHGLDYVMAMRPVTFTWKDSGKLDLGMIADEVAALDPLFGAYRDDGTLYNFRDRAVLATTIKAIQELEHRLENLEALSQ